MFLYDCAYLSPQAWWYFIYVGGLQSYKSMARQQWWSEQIQQRCDARAGLDAARKSENEELDSLFTSLRNSVIAKINALVLEESSNYEEAARAKKLVDLDVLRNSEALKTAKEKHDLEHATKLKEEQAKLKEESEKRADLSEKLKKTKEELEKLKKENDKRDSENQKQSEELKKAEKELEAEEKRQKDLKTTQSSISSQNNVFQNAQKAQLEKKAEQTSANAPATNPLAPKTAPAGSNSTSTSSPFGAPKSTFTSNTATSSPFAAANTSTAGAGAAKPAPTSSTTSTPAASKPASASKTGSPGDAEFAANAERIQWIKQNVREHAQQQPKEIKNFLTEAKLELRPIFGMLTNSKKQLMNCRDSVRKVFTKAKENSNPLIYQFLLNLYAKLLIEQSESEANVKLQNALPLAMLTVLLWADFPEIGDFVIPRFIKKCPQLIGYYCSINTEDGRKLMGWKKDEDTGKYESQDKYMGRLAGICAVWACMTQSKLAQDIPHPYNMGHSWKFMARMLNKPHEEVTQVDHCLVAAWWDMTALRFSEAFGKQGLKVLELAWKDWTEGYSDPPSMRLRGLGENWKLSGKIDHAWKPLV